MDDPVGVVRAWHEALNAGDGERLVRLSHEAIEISGPRGAARGNAQVREWAARSGVGMQPRRWFRRGDDVVVAQTAIWPATSDNPEGDRHEIAAAFRVAGGQVTAVSRFPDLASALVATGLDESFEVP